MIYSEADDRYTVKVRPRGGSGRSAQWQWDVYEKDKPNPVATGTAFGAEANAYRDAYAAIDDLLEADLIKDNNRHNR